MLVLVCCLALPLSSCMLTSGEQTLADSQPNGGNVSTTFVSADGETVRELTIGAGVSRLQVIAIVEVAQGELRIELLDADGAVVFAVQGRPNQQISRSGFVETDAKGVLRYRVVARGARNGSFQILYQQP